MGVGYESVHLMTGTAVSHIFILIQTVSLPRRCHYLCKKKGNIIQQKMGFGKPRCCAVCDVGIWGAQMQCCMWCGRVWGSPEVVVYVMLQSLGVFRCNGVCRAPALWQSIWNWMGVSANFIAQGFVQSRPSAGTKQLKGLGALFHRLGISVL